MIITFRAQNQFTLNNKPQIILSEGIFDNNPVVFIDFEFNWSIVERMKKVAGAKYISAKKCWFIQDEDFDLHQFKSELGGSFVLNTENYKAGNKITKLEIPQEYLAVLKRKRYSENTVKTYTNYFKDFIEYFSDTELEEVIPIIFPFDWFILYL